MPEWNFSIRCVCDSSSSSSKYVARLLFEFPLLLWFSSWIESFWYGELVIDKITKRSRCGTIKSNSVCQMLSIEPKTPKISRKKKKWNWKEKYKKENQFLRLTYFPLCALLLWYHSMRTFVVCYWTSMNVMNSIHSVHLLQSSQSNECNLIDWVIYLWISCHFQSVLIQAKAVELASIMQ